MAVPAFADMESIVNGGMKSLLSNAVMRFMDSRGEVEVAGIFHDGREAGEHVAMPRAGRALSFECCADELGACLNAGTRVDVRGRPYTIGGIETDKSGWAVLALRSAA